jgi:hypothetical protein
VNRVVIGIAVVLLLALVVPWGCVQQLAAAGTSDMSCESVVGVPASPVVGSLVFLGLIAAGVMLIFRRSGGE